MPKSLLWTSQACYDQEERAGYHKVLNILHERLNAKDTAMFSEDVKPSRG